MPKVTTAADNLHALPREGSLSWCPLDLDCTQLPHPTLPGAFVPSLIQRLAQPNKDGAITGFRNSWFFMFNSLGANAVQLWPVAQTWACGKNPLWQRCESGKRSFMRLTRLRSLFAEWPDTKLRRQLSGTWAYEFG